MALSKITKADDITLSGGVYLGGTASANYMDDYEEGTWMAKVADATSGGNESSTAPIRANYIKVGGLVHIDCRFSDISTAGLTSGNVLYVTGLPFVSNSETVSTVWRQNVGSATELIARNSYSFTYIRFDRVISNSADTTLTVSQFNNGTADFSFSMTYTTND